MAEKKTLNTNPFNTLVNASKQTDFDKYYLEVEEKQIYRKAGVDSSGEEFGTIENKMIVKKVDIADFINSQADTVGVAAYMRALAVQGESIDDYNTQVDLDTVNDFSEFPDNLADTMLAGDAAKAAFAKLDPDLKGNHTTIEGFLNSLTKETIENYIKGKVDAALPKHVEAGGE